MLFFVVHRLGGSRNSAREVAASRLLCFTAGFSGSPNGIRFQAGWPRSLPVHNPTFTKRLCGPLANSRFHHKPDPKPKNKLEVASHKADKAIQNIVELLAAA
jgi:hypothetical protein